MRVDEVISLIHSEYGHNVWRPHRDPASELVLTVLTQHTSDSNALRAFQRLAESFPSWEAVAEAEPTEIAEAIKSAGLSNVKAPRIKLILENILKEKGSLDLGFLNEMTIDDAKRWLLDLPGVGPKTARCVLLFSLGKPVMPVDTHVHRVSKRLGLVSTRSSAEQATDVLEAMVPPNEVYDFHLGLISHGRKVCRSQRPLCDRCVFRNGCPSALIETAPSRSTP